LPRAAPPRRALSPAPNTRAPHSSLSSQRILVLRSGRHALLHSSTLVAAQLPVTYTVTAPSGK
jgi:hypothetical protein